MIVLISLISFLFPLFFLPLLPDPVLGAKLFFLMAAVLLGLLIAGFRLLGRSKLSYTIASLDWLIWLFLLVSIISWFFLPPGARVRSLVQPTGLGLMIVLTFFYSFLVQLRGEKRNQLLFRALLAAGLIITLISVILFLLPDSLFPWHFITSPLWSPAGSTFLAFQFLTPLAVMILGTMTAKFSQKKTDWHWQLVLMGIVLLVGLAVNLYQTLNKKPIFLDWFSSWAVAVESFKHRPLLGLGPGNFNVAFNLYRPPEFNRTDNWALRFGAPHSWLLQVWTELGLVGLVLLILILIHSWRLVRGKDQQLIGFWLTSWLMVMIFPANIVNLFLLFLALALVRGEGKEKSFSLIIGEKERDAAATIWGLILIFLSLAGGYFLYRGLKAEILFARSLQAAAQNRGGDTYNLQLASIQANRFLIRSRIAFSQTNLALANSLAQKGEELTDDDRRQIAQLMNQAINEAKAAVALESNNVVPWENLAQIYRQLVNVVNGADQWALTTYQQAVVLEPFNPRLRVDYGGLFYGLGQYEEAAKQFEIAVNLKSDYANAWYNWAWALKQEDKLEDAIQRLQQAVNLVEKDSPDYQKASQELEDWKKELGKETEKPTAQEGQPQELTPPQPLPSPKLEEPIKLPEEAAPPLESTPASTPGE